jgi:cyclopropane fatty-acyl-phospholipid synthase-like methyltransferase
MASFPKTLVTRYFQLVNNRQFAAAQRTLQRAKGQIRKTEWNHGYFKALKGLLLAQKRNDNHYTFLQSLNSCDQQTLRQYRKEFQKHVRSSFHEDFDRGFFSAWHDYIRLLIKTMNKVAPRNAVA